MRMLAWAAPRIDRATTARHVHQAADCHDSAQVECPPSKGIHRFIDAFCGIADLCELQVFDVRISLQSVCQAHFAEFRIWYLLQGSKLSALRLNATIPGFLTLANLKGLHRTPWCRD